MTDAMIQTHGSLYRHIARDLGSIDVGEQTT